jgi:putative ABC transport system substrate-binding protein
VKRRDFIAGLGGAAIWPLAARAQQAGRPPTIGFLSPRSPEESAGVVAGFLRGLAENGVVEGPNLAVEYRWAFGDYNRLPALAGELASMPLAVLVTVGGEPSALAAKVATATIPIVAIFTADPVERGLVASLARPGGNMTGISALNGTLEGKRLGLLHDLLPRATTLGVLLNPDFPAAASQLSNMKEAAGAVGLQLHVLNATSDREIETAFDAVAQHGISALIVTVDTFFVTRRERLVTLAARHGVPTMYSLRDFAAKGGLMSYGINLTDIYRQAGVYAGRILKGSKPADLPVVQPTRFELVINLKAARSLGLTVPPSILATADEVIE